MGEREVVERRHATLGVADVLRQGEALGEVGERAFEHAEQVVRLAERARLPGLLGELQGLAGERRGALGVAAVMGGEAEVGHDPGSRGELRGRVERGPEALLGERPFAAAVVHLAEPLPEGATGINVSGRRLAGPIQGFGKMWQKTYQVRMPREAGSATEVIATWKQRFPEFWPEGNMFYAPLTGIEPGEVGLIDMRLPGKMKLSTGVMVLYADEESFTLMTPQGHMFAGWITFSAIEREGETVAQAQVLMRASDPIFEVGLVLGGHRQEDTFWNKTLERLAGHFWQDDAEVDTQVVCVDKKRQWSNWTNVWHSSAIYTMGTPARWMRRLFGGPRAVA